MQVLVVSKLGKGKREGVETVKRLTWAKKKTRKRRERR